MGFTPGYSMYSIVKDDKNNYVLSYGRSADDGKGTIQGSIFHQDCATQKTYNGLFTKLEPTGNYTGKIYSIGMVDGVPCDCVTTVGPGGALNIAITPHGVLPQVATEAIFPDTGGSLFWGDQGGLGNYVWGANG